MGALPAAGRPHRGSGAGLALAPLWLFGRAVAPPPVPLTQAVALCPLRQLGLGIAILVIVNQYLWE